MKLTRVHLFVFLAVITVVGAALAVRYSAPVSPAAPVVTAPAPDGSQVEVPVDDMPPTPKPVTPIPAPSEVKSETGIRRLGQVAVTKLGIDVPLMVVGKVDERIFQKALEDGVVHYPGTASPGQVGNMFIFGHSSDYRYRAGSYKTVFARLPELKIGDTVVVEDASVNASYTYRVTGTAIVSSSDVASLSQETDGKRMLTLQTSYPIGTALKRYLVLAELVP